MSEKLTLGQVIALGHYLSEWPDKWDFQGVLDALRRESKKVRIASDFDNLWETHVADNIEYLAQEIDLAIEEAKNEIKI